MPYVGNGTNEMAMLPQLSFDVRQKLVVIHHVLDDVIAHNYVEVIVRAPVRHVLVVSREHLVSARGRLPGRLLVGFDSPYFGCWIQARSKAAFRTTNFKNSFVFLRQERGHL